MSKAKTSFLWYHFVKKEPDRGECKYCKKTISFAQRSLANLKRHLIRKHPMVPLEKMSQPRPCSPSIRPPYPENLASDISKASRPTPSPTLGTTHRMPKPLTSCLWNHFDKIAPEQGECKYCKRIISVARASTANLKRHLIKKHPTVSLGSKSPPRYCSPSTRPPDSEILASEDISKTSRSTPSPTLSSPHRSLTSFKAMEPVEDSEDIYAKSVADRLRDFPKRKRMIIRKKIDDLLFESYMEEEGL